MKMSWLPVFLLAILAISACTAPLAAPGNASSDEAALPTLRVAVLPITDVVPFYVAGDEGFFTDAGVDVELIPVSSGAERDTVVQTGEADCELTDIHGVVLTNAGEVPPLKIVSSARQATAEQPLFFLIASPQSGITEPAQLAGASIGISENTIIDYWNDRMLAIAGVDAESANVTNVPQIPVRLELMLNGQLDAAILPDPLASLARLQGATRVLDDTVNPDVAVSVIACRQETIDDNTDAVRALVAGWDQAVAAINADPDAYRNVLIENTRVPEPLQDKYTLPPFPEKAIPSAAQAADVVEWANSTGLIEAELAYEALVDPSLR